MTTKLGLFIKLLMGLGREAVLAAHVQHGTGLPQLEELQENHDTQSNPWHRTTVTRAAGGRFLWRVGRKWLHK